MVYKDGVENVCRKESFKSLERFIWSDEQKMFKERLQLDKYREEIDVVVKGKIAGKMKVEDFAGFLENIKNGR